MPKQLETIKRAKHGKDNPYYLSLREIPQNRLLTWEARGVMSYLLSKPGDWEVVISDLQQNCGRDKARRILKELISFGYIKDREPIRDPKTKRITGYTSLEVYENPKDNPSFMPSSLEEQTPDEIIPQEEGDPLTEKPFTEKPFTGKPFTGNKTLHNKDKQNTDKQNTDKQNKYSSVEEGDHPASIQSKIALQLDDEEVNKVSFDHKQNAYDLAEITRERLKLFNGRDWNIAHMLNGTSKKSGYKEYAQYFKDKPCLPQELEATIQYYRKQRPDGMTLQSPETIADWVGKYRQSLKPAETLKPYNPPPPKTESDEEITTTLTDIDEDIAELAKQKVKALYKKQEVKK